MPREMELGGKWEILPVSRFDNKYDTAGKWLSAPVPGHWQQIPQLETYAGKVVYKKPFKFMPDPARRFFLRLNGTFYWATAYLNDARLGANEGYFFPADYEITGLLMKDNLLLVEVDCPDEPDKTRKRQITGVFHHGDGVDPATNPGGIWLPVEIMASGVARIVNPLFSTVYLGKNNSYARVTGQVTIDASAAQDLRVRVSFIPRTFEGETQVFERAARKTAGVHAYHYHLDVRDPVLWWTHDHGRPDLYALKVEVFAGDDPRPSDVWETAFGIRTFEMKDYMARLNGKRLFLRGNNYPPADTRLAAVTPQRCQQDVRLARECNLNFLRVHAHVDHPAFYGACDEQGLLLWQDFPLQWGYSADIEPQALRQVQLMVHHLGNHPAVGIWCMHNEPARMFDTKKPFGALAVIRWLFSMLVWNQNRDRLDRRLADKVRRLDPQRFTTECSGERGIGRPPGDGHYYYGWRQGKLTRFHRRYLKHPESLKFLTEFGAQSFPNLESSLKFMDEGLKKIDWKHLKERHHYQPFFMKRFVDRRNFTSLADFIAATQAHQSEVNRYYIDRVRALKYKPAGGLAAFVFTDSNPAVQWSVLDYWRQPKASYFALQKAMSPVYAFTVLAPGPFARNRIVSIPVYAVNDTWDEVPITVSLTVTSPAGDRVIEQTWEQTLPPDCQALIVANPPLKLRWQGTYKMAIHAAWPGHEMDNHYQFPAK